MVLAFKVLLPGPQRRMQGDVRRSVPQVQLNVTFPPVPEMEALTWPVIVWYRSVMWHRYHDDNPHGHGDPLILPISVPIFTPYGDDFSLDTKHVSCWNGEPGGGPQSNVAGHGRAATTGCAKHQEERSSTGQTP